MLPTIAAYGVDPLVVPYRTWYPVAPETDDQESETEDPDDRAAEVNDGVPGLDAVHCPVEVEVDVVEVVPVVLVVPDVPLSLEEGTTKNSTV